MKPGPRRTPTKVLEMRGSWLARNRKKSDPSYNADTIGHDVLIKMPSWLGDDAKQVWRLVVSHLKPLGILGRMDTNALGRYATLFVQWKKLKEFVEQHGSVYAGKDSAGRVSMRPYPHMRLMIALSQDLLRLEQEFGMTPAARASFGMAAEPKEKGERGKVLEGKSRFFKD